jgi:hypothetical protein
MVRDSVTSAVQSSLAALAGVPGSQVVIIGMRLMSARRLQEISETYTLVVEYALVVDSSAEGDATALENALASLNTTQVAASLTDELAKANAPIDEITVESIGPRALVPDLASTTMTSTTESSTTQSTSPHVTHVTGSLGSMLPSGVGPLRGYVSIAITVAAAVSVVITVCVCYFRLRSPRREQFAKGQGKREQNVKPLFIDLEEQMTVSTSFAL